MIVPIPKFSKGDVVVSGYSTSVETILSRSYNNLCQVTQWRYQIEWRTGKLMITYIVVI